MILAYDYKLKPKSKHRGFANMLRLQKGIARLHERIANTRKDFHFKQAHVLRGGADVVVVEDLNLMGPSRDFLGKHMLDAGHGQFFNQILLLICLKWGIGYVKAPAAGSSKECPQFAAMRKKSLIRRWHYCEYGYSGLRDVASDVVIKKRAVGRTVYESACRDGLTG